MTDRDLMQQALDALETADEFDFWLKQESIVKALRERLAHCDRCGKKLGGEGDIHTCTPKPEQEPVAWLHPANATCVTTDPTAYARGIPLYTTPPAAQRPLVWLSEDDEREIKDRCTTVACVLRAVKAKLKDKNNG